ncbi:MAG TPA: hypothetical protein VGT41_01825 [Candidatus Babeliales bacterium]|nr:hypothetical protein [Candidatus Babeliales bacterium]
MKKLILFFTAFLLLPVTLQAIFKNCTVLRNKNTGQRVFVLSETHIDEADMHNTFEQRTDLFTVVQALENRGESVRFLVEDSIRQNVEGATTLLRQEDPGFLYALQDCFAGRFDQNGSRGGDKITELLKQWFDMFTEVENGQRQASALFLLEKHLDALGVPVKNIEIRDIFFDFIVNNMDMKAAVMDILHLDEKERKGVRGLYRIMMGKTVKSIKSVQIKDKLLDFIYSTYPVLDTGNMFAGSQYMVDATAIDDIYQHVHVQNIFLCAGGLHTEKVVEFLKSTGDYDQIYFVGKMSLTDDEYKELEKAGKPVPLYPINIQQTIMQGLGRAEDLDRAEERKKLRPKSKL